MRERNPCRRCCLRHPRILGQTMKTNWKHLCFCLTLLVFLALCFLVPEPPHLASQTGMRCRAEVLSIDDSDLQEHGLLLFGSQRLTVRLLNGPQKGEVFDACNELRAQMELDKHFAVGDKAIVILHENDVPGKSVLVAQDFARTRWSLVLFGCFGLALCVFGGWTGFCALVSFLFSCVVVWKVLIPLALRGWDPSWTSFGVVFLLTVVIMYLVAGLTRKGTVACAGAMSGIFAGLLLGNFFACVIKTNGATLPYAQALLYSGFEGLDLRNLFCGAMILACSGAVMDLAMDIASGVEEVARHNPTLPRRELLRSGLRIGRSVVGTMTTTLLLAYSGGYITLLMMFATQGNSPLSLLDNPLVAAEVVKTLVGSFSLMLVAPFTALIASVAYAPRENSPVSGESRQ